MYKYKRLQAGQLPQEHLFFMQNLQNFIITKYFKQDVDDGLSVYLDECSSCGLSITGDMKIYQSHVIKRQWHFLTAIGSTLWTSIKESFLLPKLDSSSSSVTRDIEICQSHVIVM